MIKNLFSTSTTYAIVILFFAISMAGCNSTKRINYFTDLPNAEVVNLPPMVFEERVIEKGDVLQININARSSEAASFFNKGAVAPAPSNPTQGETGTTTVQPNTTNSVTYTVDINGFLEFPIIGKVKATGYTAPQFKENLTKLLVPYLKDPLVEVQFTTFNVTFLGATGAGTKTLSMQRTTLLEGLAAAGDLSMNAKRSDILLYRDYKGERKIYRFDMRTKDVLNNRDIFQLRHNDVIYVQTRADVIAREDLGFVWSVLGLVFSLTTLGITIANNN